MIDSTGMIICQCCSRQHCDYNVGNNSISTIAWICSHSPIPVLARRILTIDIFDVGNLSICICSTGGTVLAVIILSIKVFPAMLNEQSAENHIIFPYFRDNYLHYMRSTIMMITGFIILSGQVLVVPFCSTRDTQLCCGQ